MQKLNVSSWFLKMAQSSNVVVSSLPCPKCKLTRSKGEEEELFICVFISSPTRGFGKVGIYM